MDVIIEHLRAVPAFVTYFFASLLLTAVFAAVYSFLTPYNELKLVREGNAAASLSLAGAIIGFILPLAVIIAHSVSVLDLSLWALVALIVQVAAFRLARLLLPALCRDIPEGKMAAAGFLAMVSLGVGILNAASMVP